VARDGENEETVVLECKRKDRKLYSGLKKVLQNISLIMLISNVLVTRSYCFNSRLPLIKGADKEKLQKGTNDKISLMGHT